MYANVVEDLLESLSGWIVRHALTIAERWVRFIDAQDLDLYHHTSKLFYDLKSTLRYRLTRNKSKICCARILIRIKNKTTYDQLSVGIFAKSKN